ncbi:predicted protein [Naegleria gruberi]|uniref:Predicted protein n=1 Tax=Naegleria gruberi TaxID=5762 RepID=D2V3C2_NAEGR|nr:uncharacterized protein NAEGRDRAFT_78395 [Naegleria gruberi]EFC48611.1 predicted protein [Naegleria gruberi]|eukprot:XP_002681355.1 predicted protein [Naegleria gruberi strain NEG-M]
MKNVARIISSKKLAKSSSRALALASTQECKNSLIRSTTGFATPQQQQFSTFINPSVFKTTNYVRAPETNDQPKEHYFNKILIANRGEIAVRIIKTCRKLGIKTVAVYSDADANNKHVRMADEAVYIGGSSPADSYLRANRIIAAMKQTGAEAVHPGFGFLSENASFAKAIEDAGLVFIGPPSSAISAMGDKIESKIIAERAKVNIIPGHQGEVFSADECIKIAAEKIGYPVMIKASAGGGGKGMRIAYNEQELREGFRLSQDEAIRNFGSDKMLIERFVENPRHIEIQIICDQHGNYLYLPERECSIQRRNQKVIEEAPSSVIDEATRKAMGEQAVALAKEVGYFSAGTVEMLIDSNKNFYFLEMNTRLQVEHPITEFITGIDLVEQMIRVAAKKPLLLKQKDIKITGHATESRVYAEDPMNNFSPSVGTLHTYIEPRDDEGRIRVDSGILEGSEISVFYDPMISKTIAYGKDRMESINRMVEALDTYVIQGVRHNISLLRDILVTEDYRKGNITTKFIQKHYPEGFKGIKLSSDAKSSLIASVGLMEYIANRRDFQITGQLPRAQPPKTTKLFVNIDKEAYPVSITQEKGKYIVEFKDHLYVAKTSWVVGTPIFRAVLNDNQSVIVQVGERKGTTQFVSFMGTEFKFDIRTPKEQELHKHMPVIIPPDRSKMLIAPMPGAIVSVAVQPGQKVLAHQELVVIEAMKMQNVLKSSTEGIIKEIKVKAGDIVGNEAVLITFE